MAFSFRLGNKAFPKAWRWFNALHLHDEWIRRRRDRAAVRAANLRGNAISELFGAPVATSASMSIAGLCGRSNFWRRLTADEFTVFAWSFASSNASETLHKDCPAHLPKVPAVSDLDCRASPEPQPPPAILPFPCHSTPHRLRARQVAKPETDIAGTCSKESARSSDASPPKSPENGTWGTPLKLP